jgi:hypothetical protein
MITPACNSEAGAATVSLAASGNSSVTSTPTPKDIQLLSKINDNLENISKQLKPIN